MRDAPDASRAPDPGVRASLLQGGIATALKAGFTAAAIAAIAFAFYRSWDLLASLWPSIQTRNLLGAVLVWCALHFISPLVPVLVLSSERRLPYRDALRIHVSRLPARYLPGGVWHTVGRVVDLKALGYPNAALARFVLIENLTAPAFTLAIGGALLYSQSDNVWAPWAGALSGACVAGYCSIPWIIGLLTRAPTVSLGVFVRITAALTLFWSLAATSFLLFVTGFAESVFAVSTLEIIGAYLTSWGAGFLAVFAPQGVGVFEYVAGMLLGNGVTVLGAASIMALFRIVVLTADVCTWACGALAVRLRPRASVRA